MGIISTLISALCYWLQIQATKSRYELSKQIDEDLEGLELQRDALLAGGKPADAVLADRLQSRLLRRQGIAACLPEHIDLPAANPPPAGGPPRADQ